MALCFDTTFPVGSSAVNQYELVKLNSGDIEVSAAATDDCIGVVQDGKDANVSEAKVRVFGETYAIASAAIAAGAPLAAAASGKVVTHDGTTANPVIGTALTAAGADGDELVIFLGLSLRLGVAQ